uniref:Integrator complex subunit 9 n=1 Tax=Eptatretus burgeri TaxID=7764 RepID=A0A8C4QK56_EPTBU
MKLYSLSGHPSLPCYILKFKFTTIMLDCALDMSSAMHFLPLTLVHSPRLAKLHNWSSKDGNKAVEKELKECAGRLFVDSAPEFLVPEKDLLDLSTVDAILISNYHCMLALPYITERSGFSGPVFATEPTLQIGRQLMEELVTLIERVPKPRASSKWKNKDVLRSLPSPLKDAQDIWSWRQCYSLQEVNSALSKVRLVGFSQKNELFGAVYVTPLSSGYCLGSCNWLIQSEYERVAYMASSSLFTTHPQPMDQAPLRGCDVLLLTGLTQFPTANPDSMLGEFCSNLAVTVRGGGSVLVPCYPSGVIYDLLECLAQYLDSAGLSGTPLYFLSPVASSSLEFSQIFSEWLCRSKQSKAYLPEPPFIHAELLHSNRLKHFASIHGDFSTEFRQPCVVFAGHPSLRCGDAVHFMELWGRSSLNTVIFTEPGFNHLDALAPFQPLAMKAVHCPIDTGLNFPQVSKLLKDIQPVHVICPEQYTAPPAAHPHRSDLQLERQPPPCTMRRAEALALPVRRRYERVELSPEVAESLIPSEVKPGISVATVMASLSTRDNKHVLQPLPKTPASSAKKRKRGEVLARMPQPLLWGSVSIDRLLQSLEKQGVKDVKVESVGDGHILHLQAEDSIIQLSADSTHIICTDEGLRARLRDVLVHLLNRL